MSNRLLLSGLARQQPRHLFPVRRVPSYWALLRAWRRHRSRRRIADLDSRALKDIGVTYAEAEMEANKPFWRS
jgi:uncharacterized protein YjiS (DUF1127 family)